MRAFPLIALLGLVTLAGCLDDDSVPPVPVVPEAKNLGDLAALSSLTTLTPMNFTERVVTAAIQYSNDLYEPTMEVCADGSIYITGHTILVDTTGAPVFGSHDDGVTWSQLPFLMGQSMPADLHGATPPPSDEIFLSCGDDGWLYGVDITLATFPVNAWSNNGTRFAYHNPNAYDEAQVALQAGDCIAAPAKDRPWGAYSNGKLLMVSNPAAGPAQVGILPVPPAAADLIPTPAGIGALSGGGRWNVCAGPGYFTTDCSIPGIPDIRTDGLFAVPQRCDGQLYLVLGNAQDVLQTQVKPLYAHSTGGEITSVYGHALFDAEGTLFVGITNNTAPDANGNRTGQLRLSVSTDGGHSFKDRVFATELGQPIVHLYMDANKFGPGALVVWAVAGDGRNEAGNPTTWDWYVGHLKAGVDGAPVLSNVFLDLDEGPQPSAHVTGAGVGPDGRAYLATYVGGPLGGTPLSVWVQQAGPTLPVA
jgi:hypothetical protein